MFPVKQQNISIKGACSRYLGCVTNQVIKWREIVSALVVRLDV